MNSILKLLENKPDLEKQIESTKSVDELFSLLSKEIPDYTKEKLNADLKDIKKLSESKEALSEDELEAVSGGSGFKPVSDEEFFNRLFGWVGIFGIL